MKAWNLQTGPGSRIMIMIQGRRNVFTTGQAKLDHEDYAIKFVGGRQHHEY